MATIPQFSKVHDAIEKGLQIQSIDWNMLHLNFRYPLFSSWFKLPGNWNWTIENWTHGLVQSSADCQNKTEGPVLSSTNLALNLTKPNFDILNSWHQYICWTVVLKQQAYTIWLTVFSDGFICIQDGGCQRMVEARSQKQCGISWWATNPPLNMVKYKYDMIQIHHH